MPATSYFLVGSSAQIPLSPSGTFTKVSTIVVMPLITPYGDMMVTVIMLHSARILVLVLIMGGLTLYYGPSTEAALFGRAPDSRGLRTVQAQARLIRRVATETVPSMMIAGGIAVQSQWSGFPVDTLEVFEPYLGGNSNHTLGIAQMSDRDIQLYIPGGDPLNPADAIQAMAKRLQLALSACHGCSPTDQFIVASQAQNNMVNATDVNYILDTYRDSRGLIDWERYFANQPLPGGGAKNTWLTIRAGQGRSWGQFQLQVFTNDLQGLIEDGWRLPEGVGLDYMQCIAGGLGGCTR
jgi:hypothetical protein